MSFCESDKLNNLTKERTFQIVSEICNVFSWFCLTAFLVFKLLLQNKLLYPNFIDNWLYDKINFPETKTKGNVLQKLYNFFNDDLMNIC